MSCQQVQRRGGSDRTLMRTLRHLFEQANSLYKQCLARYPDADTANSVFNALTELFDHLPLAATIGSKVFAVSSGLSPSVQFIDHIRAIDRFQDVPSEGERPLSASFRRTIVMRISAGPIYDLLHSQALAETSGFGCIAKCALLAVALRVAQQWFPEQWQQISVHVRQGRCRKVLLLERFRMDDSLAFPAARRTSGAQACPADTMLNEF